MTTRGVVGGPRKVPLTPEHLAKLRGIVAEHGTEKAAKHLRCGEMTIVELSTGGYVRVDTRDRVAKALEAA